jgi:hypothetical protein
MSDKDTRSNRWIEKREDDPKIDYGSAKLGSYPVGSSGGIANSGSGGSSTGGPGEYVHRRTSWDVSDWTPPKSGPGFVTKAIATIGIGLTAFLAGRAASKKP